MPRKEINPNADIDFIDNLDLTSEHNFPKFIRAIKFEPFRHIRLLDIKFKHPISVISGVNRSGKSTVLMAIACSHFDFKKRNIQNGKLERHTWNSLMRFTSKDIQTGDWTYYMTYKLGAIELTRRGQRKVSSKKWNGIGKKESQFTGRQVVFVDLDRTLPARNFGLTIYNKAQGVEGTAISRSNVKLIEKYISYILEEDFELFKLAEHADKDIFRYKNLNEYSSYNAATGEEVLTKMIIDIIEAPQQSLILIDEIEIGLHPKIQRRLIQTIYNIARNDHKQFIITTHSPSILSSVPDKARIFIEKKRDGDFAAIADISVNAALSKMDSISYPLIDLYCEDTESCKIIKKAISSIQTEYNINNFNSLVNVASIGSADKVYSCFKAHQLSYPFKRQKTGYACILDGDRNIQDSSNRPIYPHEDYLHFIYSNESPERFLVREYLINNPSPSLKYHLENSNGHCLFDKMIENSIVTTKEEAFELCWSNFISSPHGITYFQELKTFILDTCKKFSPEL